MTTMFSTISDARDYVTTALTDYASDYDIDSIASDITSWQDGQLTLTDSEFWSIVESHELDIVTLYRVEPTYADDYNHGTWSLEPSSSKNADLTDDGGTEFVLPAGYHVARAAFDGQKHIYDERDSYCELALADDEEPMLVTSDGYVVLERR